MTQHFDPNTCSACRWYASMARSYTHGVAMGACAKASPEQPQYVLSMDVRQCHERKPLESDTVRAT